MWERSLAVIVGCLAVWPAAAAPLKPAGVSRFFVAPGQLVTLQWQIESGATPRGQSCAVRDYAGRVVNRLEGRIAADGAVEVELRPARGYCDLEFPHTGQRFGVVALPAAGADPDPFFSIDAAMSWLVRDEAVRADLVKVLRRCGITMARERVAWGQINPARDTWDWQTDRRYEWLRQVYAKTGVEVLEMCHDTPAWVGRVVRYPDNLVAASAAWRTIARRWGATWGALEIWNEPDIFFGGDLPADQYVSLVKTIAGGLAQQRIDVPLVGGVVAHFHRAYLDNAAANGLLEHVDVISFHTYATAPAMEGLVGRYRQWLAEHGRPAMPLWITECGRPWKRGPERPPQQQDAASALDITMKAVEARACGIARYFAFVYPFYEERDNNFGMMGRQATPLRSMAAYAHAVLALSGKTYVGDLKCDDPRIRRARVFAGQEAAVVVLYTGTPDGTTTFKLDLPFQRAEGIDGRALARDADGAVPLGDGLTYIWVDRHSLRGRLVRGTPAMELLQLSQRKPPARRESSPIVLRYQWDRERVAAEPSGYRLRRPLAAPLPMAVRVFNLSAEPRTVRLEASWAGSQQSLGVRTARVPAEGFADVRWTIDAEHALAQRALVRVTVTATCQGGRPISPLAIDLLPANPGKKGR